MNSRTTSGRERVQLAAYLRFYQLEKAPFESDSENRGFILGTRSLRSAFAEIKQGLEDGLPRICVSGSAGVGKTSLCRALPKLLGNSARVVPILRADRPWSEIRPLIAKKLELQGGAISRDSLLDALDEVDRLVLVFDEAELLSHEILDHLDILLRYKGEDEEQLLHCVMLANLECASEGAETPLLWWLDEYTTLQHEFAPIPAGGMRHYVEKHLAKAGWSGGDLFDDDSLQVIFQKSDGIPREINALCEKALNAAGVRGLDAIGAAVIREICGDAPAAVDTEELPSFRGDRRGAAPTAQEMLDGAPEFDPLAVPGAGEEFKPESTFDFNTITGSTPAAPTRPRLNAPPASHSSTSAAGTASSSSPSLELADEPRPPEEPFFALRGPSRSAPPPARFTARTRGTRGTSKSRSWLLLLLTLTIGAAWLDSSDRIDLFEWFGVVLEKPAAVVVKTAQPLKNLAPSSPVEGVVAALAGTHEPTHETAVMTEEDAAQFEGSIGDFLADEEGDYDPNAVAVEEVEMLSIEDLVEEAAAAMPSDPSALAIEMAAEQADAEGDAGIENPYTALPDAASKDIELPVAPAAPARPAPTVGVRPTVAAATPTAGGRPATTAPTPTATVTQSTPAAPAQREPRTAVSATTGTTAPTPAWPASSASPPTAPAP